MKCGVPVARRISMSIRSPTQSRLTAPTTHLASRGARLHYPRGDASGLPKTRLSPIRADNRTSPNVSTPVQTCAHATP